MAENSFTYQSVYKTMCLNSQLTIFNIIFHFDINNYLDPLYFTNAAIHFNSTGHSTDDFKLMPIEVIPNDMDRTIK